MRGRTEAMPQSPLQRQAKTSKSGQVDPDVRGVERGQTMYRKEHSDTSIHQVIAMGDVQAVAQYLRKCDCPLATVGRPSPEGLTPLMIACRYYQW